MINMFNGCTSLEFLNLENFETPNIKTFSSMFSNCYSLTSLNFPNLKTTETYSIQNMFFNCSTLTSLYLPFLETNKIVDENIEGAFENCHKLVLSIKLEQCSNLIKNIPDYITIKGL